MEPEVSILALFLIGLLGGAHCLVMCGGIVSAMSMMQPNLSLHLAYNLGRISSYTLAGLVVGALGQIFTIISPWQQVLYIFAQLMLIALGIYLIGYTRVLSVLEKLGGKLWLRIQPLGKRFIPSRTPLQALFLGILWGWLPCGLVYGALVYAMASGDALQGGKFMLAFGLGTLPNLLLAGWLLNRLRPYMTFIRWPAGLLVAGFGLFGLLRMWFHH